MAKKRKLKPFKCPDGCEEGECKNSIKKVINDFDTEYCGNHWHVLNYSKVIKLKKKKEET